MSNLPHVTVATVICKDESFLLVKERSDGRVVYNQPAGHVEPGESLLDAALRETLEETAWHVKVTSLLGIYQHTSPDNGISYVRHCFIAEAIERQADTELDPDIIEAVWLSVDQIKQQELRSPMVLQAIDHYLAGQSYPLSLLHSNPVNSSNA